MPASRRRIIAEDVGSEVVAELVRQQNAGRAGKLYVPMGMGIAAAPATRAPALAAGDTIGEHVVLSVTEASGIHVDDIQIVVAVTVTAAADSRIFTFRTRDAAGGTATVVALAQTTAAGAGTLTAFVPFSFRNSAVGVGGTALAAPLLMEDGTTLTFESTIAAGGVLVTGGMVIVHYRTKGDEIVLARQLPRRPNVRQGLRTPT